MKWSGEQITAIVAALGMSSTALEGAELVSERFGFRVSYDAIKRALFAAGLETPSVYLAGGHGSSDAAPESRDTVPSPSAESVSFGPAAQSTAGLGAADCGVFALPDVHIPYHDERALQCALNLGSVYLQQFAPERRIVLINGDLVDFYEVSAHRQVPGRGKATMYEIEQANHWLDGIERLFSGARVVFTEGNHESRFTRYILDRAPKLFGMLSVDKLLRISERGWQFVPYMAQHAFIGDCLVSHEIGYCGKYALNHTSTSSKSKTITGHTHRAGLVCGGDVHGEPQWSASFGWLGLVDNIDYKHRAMALREWSHGCGTAYVDHNGRMHVPAIHTIRDGCAYLNGKPVRA